MEQHSLDLTTPEGLARAEHASAGVDILVNAAGTQLRPRRARVPARGVPRDAHPHAGGPVPAHPRCPAGMYERGWGRVVHISSVHGLRASAYKSAYVAAKHGLEGLSKTTALEAAPQE